MKTFMTIVLFIFSLFFTAISAAVIPRDVYVPPLLTPNSGAVWKVGGTYEVVWDTSNPPKQITNPKGRLILAKNSRLDLDHPLAQGFDILIGRLNVTVPKDTKPGNDYQLVLMGDSGNYGAKFAIAN